MTALLQLTLCIFAGFVPCVESSAIINVTEISVARSRNKVLNEMVALKRPQNVIDKTFTTDLTADGFFDVNDLSSLTVRVKGPVVGDAGTYACVIKGLDATGQNHETVESLTVGFNVSKVICPNVLREDAIFFPRLVYEGSSYYLSKIVATNSSMAEDICSHIGGYLIEVDDHEELQMAYQLTKQYNQKTTLIAGTDVEQEGVWIFPRTGSPVGTTNWDKDQPDNYGDNEDCRAISFFNRMDRINDIPCVYYMSFICEVSQTPEYVIAV